PGLGVEDMILAAFTVEPLPPEQIGFAGHSAGNQASGIAPLLDRLGNRLGLDALSRVEPRESHIPERASVRVPVDSPPPPAARVPWRIGDAPPDRRAHARTETYCASAWSIPNSPDRRAHARTERTPVSTGEGWGGGKPLRPVRLFEPP